MARRKMKKKAKLFIVVFILVIISIIGFVLYSNNIEVYFKEIEVEVNEKTYNTDLIEDISKGKLVSDKQLLDTSKVGKHIAGIEVKGLFGNKTYYDVIYFVVDSEAPKISINNKEVSVSQGEDFDFSKNITIEDNSKETITCDIEGDYDFNKVGRYELSCVAKDSSGNKAKESFTLVVKQKGIVSDPKKEEVKKEETKKEESKKEESKKEEQTSNGNKTSKGYEITIRNGITYVDGVLIANKTYALPESYAPGGVNSDTQNAFDKMAAAALLEGYNINLQSGFRSYETQNRIYNSYVNDRGKEAADTFSARPGHSEHQTGLAFDVCEASTKATACINSNFDSTAAAKWLSDNAYKYGLILRYPKGKTDETGYKYESWHFRYVGEELASKLYNNGDWITLESYYGITSEYQ